MGLTIPEEYGGEGKGMVEFCIAVEELARASAAIASYFRISLSLAIPPIAMFGTPEQKKRWLVPHARGEKLACFGLTETGAGSDPASVAYDAIEHGKARKRDIVLIDTAGMAQRDTRF